MFEFKKEYETGIEEIDREHRQFFEYIDRAVKAMDLPEEEGIKEARDLLHKLIVYAGTHLDHEEEYMKRTDDPELPVQVAAHRVFTEHVAEMTIRKDDLKLKDLGEIFIFMAKWLRSHVITMDKMIGKMKRTEGKFVMTSDYMTGIDFVDHEHEKLFEIIGRAHDAIENEMLHDRFDAIMDILKELREYTVMHFSDEERYMESIGYDGLAAQKAVHESFVDRISDIDIQDLSDEGDDQNSYLRSLVVFLNDWLVSHIKNMDKKIPDRKDGVRP